MKVKVRVDLSGNYLLKKFYNQIQKLHEDWKVTGTKTIILIDGLDHIEREQHPARSLLEDLPAA